MTSRSPGPGRPWSAAASAPASANWRPRWPPEHFYWAHDEQNRAGPRPIADGDEPIGRPNVKTGNGPLAMGVAAVAVLAVVGGGALAARRGPPTSPPAAAPPPPASAPPPPSVAAPQPAAKTAA